MNGIGIGTSFIFNKAPKEVSPNALIASWYNGLSVKPSDDLLTDLNTLSQSLSDAGIWAELDLFHPIGGLETDEQRLTPIISTSGSNFTNVNSATLDVNGVTGNGTSSYLNLNWNPNTNSVKYTQNSASYGFYNRTNNTGGYSDVGAWDATNGISVNPRFTDDKFYLRINQSNGLGATASVSTYTDCRGLIVVERSNATNDGAYRNGSSLFTSAKNSNGLPNNNIYLCCYNFNGTAANFSTRNYALVFFGSSAINQSNFYTIIQAYMTARDINV